MAEQPTCAEIAARARAYPFGVPEGSFLFAGGAREGLETLDGYGDRVALLAIGANGSPQGLAAKLGERSAEARIPVVAAELHDFDVVYSAHVAPYGSIAAALQHCPGAVALLHVVHLTDWQLELVDRVEVNYVLAELEGVRLTPELGESPVSSVLAYVSRHGCLCLDGEHVGLAAIPVAGRSFPALDEPAMLARVRDELDPGTDLEDFICEQVRRPEVGRERTERLRRASRPLDWPRRRIVRG